MILRTVPRISFGASLVLGLASLAYGAPSPEDETRRLTDHLFFVRELQRDWEPLLADLERTAGSYEKESAERKKPLLEIADRAREDYANSSLLAGEKGETRRLALFEQLAGSALDAGRRPAFHEKAADILMAQAERAETKEKDDAKALDLAKRALGHKAGDTRAIAVIRRLGMKVGLAFKASEDYEKALEKFDATAEALRAVGAKASDLADVQREIDDIQKSTGPLRVVWLGDPQVLLNVKGPKTTFTAATLRLTGGGREPPQLTVDQLLKQPRRVRTGQYTVTATGSGGGETYSAPVTITSNGGEVTLVPALPGGMILVPANGVNDAFLIDKTEVSVDQFRQMGGRSLGGSPNTAAAGVTFREAQQAAQAAGKSLPTLAQWTHAAFGSPNAPSPVFPWGNNEGQPGVHFATGGVSDVNGAQAGKSPLGCLNMTGNVWEWLDTGWLIGGSAQRDVFFRDVQPPTGAAWRADFLRSPLPPLDVYEAMTNAADRDRYFYYHGSDSTMQQVGMRCVVPLGKPRR